MTELLRKTTLPTGEAPQRVIVTPTMDRWGTLEQPGHLPRMLRSVQERVSAEGLDGNSWMVVGDASSLESDKIRDRWLPDLDEVDHPSRIFILRPEFQRQVADIVQKRTGIRAEVVDAVLYNTGYASQRQKLDAVMAAIVFNNGPMDVATFDDDTLVPQDYRIFREEVLPRGLSRVPNSQVLWPGEVTDAMFDMKHNRLSPMFQHLGMTVGQIRQQHTSFRATTEWVDTMHARLEDMDGDNPVQFVVTNSDGPDVAWADEATIIAAASTKHGVPDYRTVKIADIHLRKEFPFEEMPIKSFPSGPNRPFAFGECDTNVDSAAFARRLDERTSLWPWWFVSSEAISKDNPLQTVKGHYRADNELLPVLLKVIHERTGQHYMYESGIATQIYHNRAQNGYRPNIHEQAAASLVGNVAAMAAADRLEFDQDGRPRVNADDRYKVSQDRAEKVFYGMMDLASICGSKVRELTARSSYQPTEDNNTIEEKIRRYRSTYDSIRRRLAGFNFPEFFSHLDNEVNAQLKFYSEVLYATPIVVSEVQRLIQNGQYPVLEYVPPADRNKSYPH